MQLLRTLPKVGENLYLLARKVKDSFLGLVTPGFLFEALGFQYVGPVDGYNLAEMVERRKRRELPKGALEFLDETASFCPAFREQMEAEERLLERELQPLKEVEVKALLFSLTPYTDIVEESKGKVVAICQRCGFAYCEARENFKLYCLVYDRDPQEVLPGRWGYDRQWCGFREFYCPGCGTQVEVEATPPGTPILQNYSLAWD